MAPKQPRKTQPDDGFELAASGVYKVISTIFIAYNLLIYLVTGLHF